MFATTNRETNQVISVSLRGRLRPALRAEAAPLDCDDLLLFLNALRALYVFFWGFSVFLFVI